MKAGKQVVTANKDLLAEYGDPLFEIATENKCDLQFEAAVAGAIPIIRPLRQSLAGSQLTEIMGIVNGTTNYILTKMSEEGMGYQEALDMATRLGYAEADPTADVEGYDAGRIHRFQLPRDVPSGLYGRHHEDYSRGYPVCERIRLCD